MTTGSVECPMCKKVVGSLKSGSHILPAFFLRPIRDSGGKIRVIDVFKSIVNTKEQDLPKGTFICQVCEDLTARLDGYAANALKDPVSVRITTQAVQSGRVEYEDWQGIEFQKFRDFVMSVAVRDHCWRISKGMPRLMTDAEYEGMRGFLMSSPPKDDASFPIVIHKIRPMPAVPNIHRSTSPPTISRPGDAISFVGMGYAVMVYFKKPVTSGMEAFNGVFKLKGDNSIKMALADLLNIGTFKHSVQAIVDSYDKLKKK